MDKLSIIGLVSLLVSVGIYIIKKILDKSIDTKFDKILKAFETEKQIEIERLRHSFAYELESFKSRLEKDKILFNIQNAQLQKKRADVIEDLYKRINQMVDEANKHYVFPESGKHPWTYFSEVSADFRDKEIYFSEDLIIKYRSLISKFVEAAHRMDILKGKQREYDAYLYKQRVELADA